MTAKQIEYLFRAPKSFIVRFAGTAPNHYDAPTPRLVEAESKEEARALAAQLAAGEGLTVSSVRHYHGSHRLAINGQPAKN